VKYRVRLTAKAERDLDRALGWFYDQGALAAGRRWFRQLLTRIEALAGHPQRCSLAAEATELEIELRELHFGRRPNVYRILFVISGQSVDILHIRRSARDSISVEDW
jgi:plasmid stabilization system protein ParE